MRKSVNRDGEKRLFFTFNLVFVAAARVRTSERPATGAVGSPIKKGEHRNEASAHLISIISAQTGEVDPKVESSPFAGRRQ